MLYADINRFRSSSNYACHGDTTIANIALRAVRRLMRKKSGSTVEPRNPSIGGDIAPRSLYNPNREISILTNHNTMH
jgi:hypothetical protein